MSPVDPIRYSVAPCRLGWLLLAATRRGVCQVRFADSEAEALAGLADELPFASPLRDDAALAAWRERLVAYVDGRTAVLELPLDVAGSRFQRRVWEALAAIPRGSTRSYAAVARSLGRPTAARAVARACATNPVPVAVPCHRVVGSDGRLTGYRYGLVRKRALLEMEQRPAGGVALEGAEPPQATRTDSASRPTMKLEGRRGGGSSPSRTRSGRDRASSSNITWSSSRARLAPRQKWAP